MFQPNDACDTFRCQRFPVGVPHRRALMGKQFLFLAAITFGVRVPHDQKGDLSLLFVHASNQVRAFPKLHIVLEGA
jgi:hypothetical protein